jgi:hypothetical protein
MSLCYYLWDILYAIATDPGTITMVQRFGFSMKIWGFTGHSPSLVRARSQEELEAVFAGSLWRTGLTGVGQQSDRSASQVWPVMPNRSSFRGWKVLVGHHAYSPTSRRHQGPCKTDIRDPFIRCILDISQRNFLFLKLELGCVPNRTVAPETSQ